jgi:hypothetical protein
MACQSLGVVHYEGTVYLPGLLSNLDRTRLKVYLADQTRKTCLIPQKYINDKKLSIPQKWTRKGCFETITVHITSDLALQGFSLLAFLRFRSSSWPREDDDCGNGRDQVLRKYVHQGAPEQTRSGGSPSEGRSTSIIMNNPGRASDLVLSKTEPL